MLCKNVLVIENLYKCNESAPPWVYIRMFLSRCGRVALQQQRWIKGYFKRSFYHHFGGFSLLWTTDIYGQLLVKTLKIALHSLVCIDLQDTSDGIFHLFSRWLYGQTMGTPCSSGNSLWFDATTFQRSLSMMSAKNHKTLWVPDQKNTARVGFNFKHDL